MTTLNIKPRALSLELAYDMLFCGVNPLKADSAYRKNFLDKLSQARIKNLSDLVAASNLLDCLAHMRLHRCKEVVALLTKARAFLERFPQLLETGWLRRGSAMKRLMAQMRLERTTQAASAAARSGKGTQ